MERQKHYQTIAATTTNTNNKRLSESASKLGGTGSQWLTQSQMSARG